MNKECRNNNKIENIESILEVKESKSSLERVKAELEVKDPDSMKKAIASIEKGAKPDEDTEGDD